jgi:hypothetical protein
MNSSSVQDEYIQQYKSARVFLENCNLIQYLPMFIAEGFDSIEAVSALAFISFCLFIHRHVVKPN